MKTRINLTIEKKLYDLYKTDYNMSKLFNKILSLHEYVNNCDENKVKLLLDAPELAEFLTFKGGINYIFEKSKGED
jgi:hypothetical protein